MANTEGEERPQGEADTYRKLHELQTEKWRLRYAKAVDVVVTGIPKFGVPKALAWAVCTHGSTPLPPAARTRVPPQGAQSTVAPQDGSPYSGWPHVGDVPPTPDPRTVPSTRTQHGPYPGPGWPGSGGLLQVQPVQRVHPEDVEMWVVWTGYKSDLTVHRTEVEALRAAVAVRPVPPHLAVVPVQYGEPVMEAVGAYQATQVRKRQAEQLAEAEAREAMKQEMTRESKETK